MSGYSGYGSSVSTNTNATGNSFNNGPSVYLYGFLAVLGLIFLVTLGVAWRGYRARRLLRAQLNEALARGMVIDTGEDNPRKGTGSITTPELHEDHIEFTKDSLDLELNAGWNIKPTAIAAIRPAVLPSTTPTIRRSFLVRHFVIPVRDYWISRGPAGIPLRKNEEKELDLTGAEGLAVVVLIAMPNASRREEGRDAAGMGSSAHPHPSDAMTASVQDRTGLGVATTSEETGRAHENDEKELLPELVMGVAEVGLRG